MSFAKRDLPNIECSNYNTGVVEFQRKVGKLVDSWYGSILRNFIFGPPFCISASQLIRTSCVLGARTGSASWHRQMHVSILR